MITWLIIIASVLYYIVSWRITLAFCNKQWVIGRDKYGTREPVWDLLINMFFTTIFCLLWGPTMIGWGIGIVIHKVWRRVKLPVTAIEISEALAWTSRAEKKRKKLAP